MTEKQLFIGKKTEKDRFTIISDYDGEIGVKENWSGDVLVIKHDDLGTQQFVAQLVQFLNDQNQAITDLYTAHEFWEDKATEMINELKTTIHTYQKGNALLKNTLNNYKTENQQIRNTITEALQKERTQIGQNVLKQLMEAIE